jgi:hypothetical protein
MKIITTAVHALVEILTNILGLYEKVFRQGSNGIGR